MSAKWSGRELIKKLSMWPWSIDPPAFEPGGLFFWFSARQWCVDERRNLTVSGLGCYGRCMFGIACHMPIFIRLVVGFFGAVYVE